MSEKMNRREFLKRSAYASAAAALATMFAPGTKVLGANDRIRIGVVGPGSRASGLMQECHGFCEELNMELVASCDIWNRARERGAALIEQLTGKKAIQCRNLEEICARDDVDALIIGTADFQHALHCAYAVRAGKDVYVEKPLANNLDDAKQVLRAVQESGRIVQVGTQRRSDGEYPAAREFIASGQLGTITYIEGSWNYFGPRWRRGDVESELKEEDTDWQRFRMNRPYEPWDAHKYREFRLYWPYSSGIPCQWLSHIVDIVQYVMDDPYPSSVVAHGGVYIWKDGRKNVDTFQALLEYPKGYLFSYSTRFGNDSSLGGGITVYGSNGRIDIESLKVSGAGGGGSVTIEQREREPHIVHIDGSTKIKEGFTLEPHEDTNHMRNWMECIRTRKQPNAHVEGGYSHSIATIMAIRALHSGRKITFDPVTHTMSEG